MKTRKPSTRRELIKALAVTGAAAAIVRPSRLFGAEKQASEWVKYEGNPVLGGKYGTCFDICVLRESSVFRMWVSWRPKQSVAITECKDGINWNPPEIVLGPRQETGWEDDINRPVVVRREDGYHMWYTGQAQGKSAVGYATSADGRTWTRKSTEPVLKPSLPWEGVAIMCPHAIWDAHSKIWKMWYSAGTQYEPDAIGYATSADGLHWEKYPANPVIAPNPHSEWEQNRVAAAQILRWEGWYYAFYIGFRDIDHAQIGMARSRDGVTGWMRHAGNPIVRPTPGGWDGDACYKPYAVFSDGRWRLWYNGRENHLEQIGLVVREGKSLGFTAEA
jgi:beta-1,2-mannobiose phosphorylase / 1,2-beta-oligomannan phosphorylase